MNSLTKDYIAIDTNVFEHLFFPKMNTNKHIDELLLLLANDEIKLLVDKKKRIIKEYQDILGKRDYRGPALLPIFRYWLKSGNHIAITVNFGDELMGDINKILPSPSPGKRNTDRIFVYVAFREERILITNDRKTVIDKKNLGDGLRREELRKIAKKHGRKPGADILTSKEAQKKAMIKLN